MAFDDLGADRLESQAMIWVLIAVLVVIALLVVWLIALYNGLVQKRNRVDNAWAQIDVQLKRRRDLIPNLDRDGQGLRGARARHVRGRDRGARRRRGRPDPAQTGAAEGILSQALGRLFAVAEAYPDLKANQNFLDLQAQLQDTENKIAVSRQVYNDTVLTYNNAIQVFPAVLIAGAVRLHEARVLRDRGPGDRDVPAVSFQPDASAPAAPAAPAPAAPPAADAPSDTPSA